MSKIQLELEQEQLEMIQETLNICGVQEKIDVANVIDRYLNSVSNKGHELMDKMVKIAKNSWIEYFQENEKIVFVNVPKEKRIECYMSETSQLERGLKELEQWCNE